MGDSIARKPNNRSGAITKFIIFSILGVFLFFITVPYKGARKVPLLHIIGALTSFIGMQALLYMVMLGCIVFLILSLYTRFNRESTGLLKDIFGRDGALSYFTYITSVLFSIMVMFNIGPEVVLNPDIGMSSMEIAVDSFMAMFVAGSIVPLLLEYGLLDFIGRLMSPLMRGIYQVPGAAAVDALSSFVAAPAVGVMITDSLYRQDIYTQREASAITTNFSIASLGGFAFLSAIAGVQELYGQLVIASFIVLFLVGIIMIRIPPLSRKKNVYFSGREQTEEERRLEKYDKNTIRKGIEDGIKAAEEADGKRIINEWIKSIAFAFKVNSFIISLSVICLFIANYTPIIDWIGLPMVPILKLFGLADAEVIAAPSIISVFALSLPATLIKGKAIAAASAFFVLLVSTTQIIFFTESANAMLESDIPLSFMDLLVIFLLRSVFIIPIATLITRILIA